MVKLYYPAVWAQRAGWCPVRVVESLCTLNTPRKCFLIKIDIWGKVTVLPGFLLLLTNEKCYVLTWEFKATELHLTKLREVLFETSGSSSHTVHAGIRKSIQLRCNFLSWEFLAWNKFWKNLWDYFFPFPYFSIYYKRIQPPASVLFLTYHPILPAYQYGKNNPESIIWYCNFWVREALELQLKSYFFIFFIFKFFFEHGILSSLLHTEHIHSDAIEITI